MYFYVSENISMLILMKAFQKKMNICQVRSLFKKKKKLYKVTMQAFSIACKDRIDRE